MLVAEPLVIGEFLFVFSNLLLDLLNGRIQSRHNAWGGSGSDEIGRSFGRNVDFHMRFVKVFEIDGDFDRVDPIVKLADFFSLFRDQLLIRLFQMPMTGRYVHLHKKSPQNARKRQRDSLH